MKITCDIISDLLPSYIDSICTEDSCELVENHIRICDKCKQKLNYMIKPIERPEILDEGDTKEPFMKIKKKNRIQLFIAVIITACIIAGGMLAIQEVAPLHDFFYPTSIATIDNETEQMNWVQVNISGNQFLNFTSVFYNKEMINDANSSGSVTIRILDESKNIVLEEITVEPGETIQLNMLQNNQNYIVEAKCKKGRYFLNFI